MSVNILDEQPEALLALPELRFSPLTVGNVADHGNYRHGLWRLHRTEHNIDRKFGAVLSLADQLSSCTHRTHAQFFAVTLPVQHVDSLEAIGYQDFHRLGN